MVSRVACRRGPQRLRTELSQLLVTGTPGELSPIEAIPDDLPGRWWVAHTKPRNEKSLASDLVKLGIAHYLPLRRRQTRSRRTRRISRSLIPVFPGYLFFNGLDEQ